MTSSGTFAFNPPISDLVFYAYSLCGVRRPSILQEHMVDARMAANMVLASWNNETPNLWTIDLVTVDLVAGQAVYSVDPQTVMVLDAYIRTVGQDGGFTDRIIWPISRTEYASMPNKTTQAPPTVFWFDRLINPSLTLWQVPDDGGPYQLCYYRCVQIQDANLPDGETVNLPPRWLDAFAWGLAARLAVSYAPDRAVMLDGKAKEAWNSAAEQDTENVNLYIAPSTSGYYTR